jgi:hypothetical protein
MSSNGYNFFINYVQYLLYKHKKKRNIYKEYHEYKIQEIKNVWSKIDRKLEIDDDDYYYAGILLYCLLDNGFKLNYLNMKRYTIGVVILSHKFNDDFAHDNIDWADILLYEIEDINQIEKNLLDFLEFKIYITDFEYETYKEIIEKKLKRTNKITKIINNIAKRF